MTNVPRLRLSGEYDLCRREEVAGLFSSVGDVPQLELDFTDVTYVDSTVLTEMVKLRRRLPDCQINIVGAAPNLQRLLHVVGFEQIFRIDDTGQAIDSQ